MHHQNPIKEMRSSPYVTGINDNLAFYEKWLNDIIDQRVPKGEALVEVIMNTIEKLHQYPNRQGNIKLILHSDKICFEVTHFASNMFGEEIVTKQYADREKLFPPNASDLGIKVSLVERDFNSECEFHPGIAFHGIMLYE